jgi:hypothetical protein
VALKASSGGQLGVDQLGDDLGVGVALEDASRGGQFGLQLGEVFDDAVVHQGHPSGGVGVGVLDIGRAVGGPADVADAVLGDQRLLGQNRLEVLDLALGPAALDLSIDDGGDAGRIVAPVFKPLEAVDQPLRHGLVSDDADDAAHGP